MCDVLESVLQHTRSKHYFDSGSYPVRASILLLDLGHLDEAKKLNETKALAKTCNLHHRRVETQLFVLDSTEHIQVHADEDKDDGYATRINTLLLHAQIEVRQVATNLLDCQQPEAEYGESRVGAEVFLDRINVVPPGINTEEPTQVLHYIDIDKVQLWHGKATVVE